MAQQVIRAEKLTPHIGAVVHGSLIENCGAPEIA